MGDIRVIVKAEWGEEEDGGGRRAIVLMKEEGGDFEIQMEQVGSTMKYIFVINIKKNT